MLNPYFILTAVLLFIGSISASAGLAYKAGKEAGQEQVQAVFDAYVAEQTAEAEKLRAERDAIAAKAASNERNARNALDAENQRVADLSRQLADSQRLRVSLQKALAAARGSNPQVQPPGPGGESPSEAIGGVLAACAATAVELGDEAERLASQVRYLQSRWSEVEAAGLVHPQ